MNGVKSFQLITRYVGSYQKGNVDGKQVQIQITGFMEKNTGKFMRELWSLLTSAQNNISKIPQQFLDEKAEETRQKKVEFQFLVMLHIQREIELKVLEWNRKVKA
jgi:serine/arginine repetitive matrix protein 1